jgi:hypothetical protein
VVPGSAGAHLGFVWFPPTVKSITNGPGGIGCQGPLGLFSKHFGPFSTIALCHLSSSIFFLRELSSSII